MGSEIDSRFICFIFSYIILGIELPSVQFTSPPFFAEYPPAKYFGDIAINNIEKAISLVKENYFNLAIEDMKLKNEEVLMVGDDIVADIGGAKNIFLKTIQVKTGKFQKKDETNIYLQPDYRINSISELSYLLGIELTEKNH